MPMRGELPTVATRSSARSAPAPGWSRVVAAVRNPDLHFVLGFCLMGFLATVDAVLRFPDFGALVAQLALFP